MTFLGVCCSPARERLLPRMDGGLVDRSAAACSADPVRHRCPWRPSWRRNRAIGSAAKMTALALALAGGVLMLSFQSVGGRIPPENYTDPSFRRSGRSGPGRFLFPCGDLTANALHGTSLR